MNCWSCQAENPPAAKFCFNCGSRLVPDPATEAPCRSCAAPLPVDARFCGNCGTPDPVAPVVAPPASEAPPFVAEPPAPLGLADMLEPSGSQARFGDTEPSPQADPSALAYDHEDDEEATVTRPQLEEAPVMGAAARIESRERPHTEPAKVAVARTLAERLGRGGESPGAYSKKGPSLRKLDTKGKPPPPPPIGGAKPSSAGLVGTPGPPRKADTKQSLPRAGLPVRSLGDAGAKPVGSRIPPAPAVAPRPGAQPPASARPLGDARPLGEARPLGLPRMPPSSAAKTATSPAVAAKPKLAGLEPASPPEPARPRATTEPQKVVFATSRPSEVAEILASPEGWPDITDELAEVRFSALQGVDASVRAELEALRIQYPTHPEVQALALELGIEDVSPEDSVQLPVGVPTRTRPPIEAAPSAELIPVEGPPPLGRFPVTPPTGLPFGAPQPASFETSDELLAMDADEFDGLDEPDPGESMTDLTLVDRLDLSSLGVRDADELDDLDLGEGADDLGEAEEPDFVDRTMMVASLQPPAPYGTDAPAPSRPAAERRATLAPDLRAAVDERSSSTLAPGEASPLDDDEHGATIPPGGYFVAGHDEPPTLSGLDDGFGRRSSTLAPDLYGQPAAPAPFTGPGGEPPPEAGMTAPDRDADSAAASGQFRVADLGLDDMPDLSAGFPPGVPPDAPAGRPRGGSGGSPSRDELEIDLVDDELIDDELIEEGLTEEGTVIVRSPVPPAPYGRDGAPVPVVAVRLVMLGARGEPVCDRLIAPGSFFDVGREAGEPWAEDRRMEPLHARLFPGPGGVIVDDFGLPSGVYTQIIDTIAVDDGDEFKVGQARLALQRVVGRGWGQLTVVRHDAAAPQTLLLDRDEIIIGREEGDITLPNDTFVSGDHCRFLREGHAIYLEDLGSSNGTYVRVRAGQCVAFGGLLLVGHTQFRVEPA